MATLSAFVIYSSLDVEYYRQLRSHFYSIQSKLLFRAESAVHDEQHKKLDFFRNIEGSDIVFFLVSAASLTDRFIQTIILPKVEELRRKGKLHFIPIIIKHYNWQSNLFLKSVQVLPNDGVSSYPRPIQSWKYQEEAWTSIANTVSVLTDDILLWRKAITINTIEQYLEYLSKFQNGIYYIEAQNRISFLKQQQLELDFSKAKHSIQLLEAFKIRYKDEYLYIAKADHEIARIKDQQEREALRNAINARTFSALETFKIKFPASKYMGDVNKQVIKLTNEEERAWQEAFESKSVGEMEKFLKAYPDGPHLSIAKATLTRRAAILAEKRMWEFAVKSNLISIYEQYIEQYPNGYYLSKAKDAIALELQKEPQHWALTKGELERASSIKQKVNIYKNYLFRYPNGASSFESNMKIAELDDTYWKEKGSPFTPWNTYSYLKLFPNAKHKKKAETWLLVWMYSIIASMLILLIYFAWGYLTANKSGFDPKNFVSIEPRGTFYIGRVCDLRNCDNPRRPRNFGDFKVPKYKLAKFEFSRGDWEKLTGENTGDASLPLIIRDENHAKLIIDTLNRKFPKRHYRLPTETEWEFAANEAEKDGKALFSGHDDWDKVGWVAENSNGKTHTVGQKMPNRLGLYDMTGNVAELTTSDKNEPPCPNCISYNKSIGNNVYRGGSSGQNASECQVTFRALNPGKLRGLRLVLEEIKSKGHN